RLFGNASPLVLARLASAALTFSLPLVLVRLLDPAVFGAYKQFFLVGQTVLLLGQIGLGQSLFYFLPRGRAERGAYVAHAPIARAAALVALGRCAALTLLVARGVLPVARPRLRLFREQLAYALPFAAAMWLYVGQRYFAQYAVAARFDPATFALYTIAAFHLP